MFGFRHLLRLSLQNSLKSLKNSNLQTLNFLQFQKFPQNSKILRKLTTTAGDLKPEESSNSEKSSEIQKYPIAKISAQMRVVFTCKKCETRNSKTMSKLAYEKGVVIIRCDGCKNNHLIADNLGWFGVDPRKRNIEKIMKLHGEKVKRLTIYGADTMEFINKEGGGQ